MQTKKGRYGVAIALFLVALAAGGAWLLRDRFFTDDAPVYMTVPVVRQTIQETVSSTGVIMASKQVDVGAQVSGQIQSLKVALGDSVKKGQLLAVIDPSVKRNDLKDAEAELKRIQAQKRVKQALLKQYELEFKRQLAMRSSNASARADLESAQASLDSTRAEIDALDAQITRARISVDTARTNLGYTQILAPMDGVVVAVETDEGQTLVSSQSAPTLLILADLATMTVKTLISEADVIRVEPGMKVRFSILGDPDTLYESTLRSVDPAPETITDSNTSAKTISSTATYYNGQFDVANPDHKLRIFMTAQVAIVLGEVEQVLSIPLSVLERDLGHGRYEVRVLENGEARPRVIKTGLKNNIFVEVVDGLTESDQVVVGDSVSSAEALSQVKRRRFGGPSSRGGGPPPVR